MYYGKTDCKILCDCRKTIAKRLNQYFLPDKNGNCRLQKQTADDFVANLFRSNNLYHKLNYKSSQANFVSYYLILQCRLR